MYTLDFQTDNIFNNKHMYTIHCIGKCTNGHTPQYQDNIYYFLSHEIKYEVHESLRTLDDVKIVVKQVEEFTLPPDFDTYEIFKREETRGMKYNMLKRLEDQTYSKDGFFIFKQMLYADTSMAIGGIADIYEFERASFSKLKKMLDTMKYNK